jgi:hypothetical protein
MSRRPWVANKTTAVAVGLLLFVAGMLLLYDAYDRRGGRAPWIIRAFIPN